MSTVKVFTGALLASAILFSLAAPASAGPVGGMARSLRMAPASQYISASRNTLAPFAFIRFCRDNMQDCEAGQGQAVVEMDQDHRRELAAINFSVNRAIKPTYDGPNTDTWEADVASGDCEDFALTKRRKLIAAGWPSKSLRMAVVKTAQGEGHAVLVVKTSQGDLVLDNRTNMIRPWNRTDLTWLKIQSEDNPKLWLEI
ncbi:transglutaminase-like cysteine peptidase [Rhizobium terrae]|uniref:transglutaminase-like cysteine peptidase n=1 Tax=Rhizobium terrae TaxID=2171756 RepID=UPI000E3B8963|nr:transglutaminase-like cysteine peptidase [Rhizobium terrae]